MIKRYWLSVLAVVAWLLVPGLCLLIGMRYVNLVVGPDPEESYRFAQWALLAAKACPLYWQASETQSRLAALRLAHRLEDKIERSEPSAAAVDRCVTLYRQSGQHRELLRMLMRCSRYRDALREARQLDTPEVALTGALAAVAVGDRQALQHFVALAPPSDVANSAPYLFLLTRDYAPLSAWLEHHHNPLWHATLLRLEGHFDQARPLYRSSLGPDDDNPNALLGLMASHPDADDMRTIRYLVRMQVDRIDPAIELYRMEPSKTTLQLAYEHVVTALGLGSGRHHARLFTTHDLQQDRFVGDSPARLETLVAAVRPLGATAVGNVELCRAEAFLSYGDAAGASQALDAAGGSQDPTAVAWFRCMVAELNGNLEAMGQAAGPLQQASPDTYRAVQARLAFLRGDQGQFRLAIAPIKAGQFEWFEGVSQQIKAERYLLEGSSLPDRLLLQDDATCGGMLSHLRRPAPDRQALAGWWLFQPFTPYACVQQYLFARAALQRSPSADMQALQRLVEDSETMGADVRDRSLNRDNFLGSPLTAIDILDIMR